MPSEREERIARNEALFRAANERAAAWEEREALPESVELFYCECADLACRQKIALSGSDYERIRRDPMLFFAAAGHEIPDVETVVEEHGDWLVVRKNPETRDVVEATDPRSD